MIMVRFLLHTKVSTPEKFEHQRKHEIFLNLDITIEDNKLVYKLFDKRDKCFFFVICMLCLSSNIPSSKFYGSVFSEFLGMARRTLRLTGCVPNQLNYILE